jgi:glycosyltransferase involved in cell wall biosynthesis
MKILFISRKKPGEFGGLSRFVNELTERFPKPRHLLTIPSLRSWLTIPWKRIDLIHLTDASLFPLGILIKSIIRKPLTVTAHGLDICYEPIWYQSILRLCSPKAHAVILDSQPIEKLLKNFPIRINKTYVINPGVSVDQFKISKSFPLPVSTDDKIVLLTVGNLVSRKGHYWFIKNVFSKLPTKYLYFIVGDGPEKRRIQSLISHMGLASRIFLLGQLDNQHLAWLYRQTDIYICPNQKISHNFEGFGIAAGEAAALDIPVVASKIDGLPSVIHDQKNGLLVNPTIEEFIKAIKKIKEIRLVENYTLKNFSWDKTIDQYQQVFKEVIDKNLRFPGRFFPR